ncbi:MAG: efflux RND transporter permease subunit [Oligoflexia bacterium]|nr:efflux RND transporter permease subunit [Oligoflexia bacterium]
MWIVRLALRRPYTIAVSVIVLFLAGFLSIKSMVIDIFPTINIPVVRVIWAYPGLSATDMERRVVFITERAFSTTVGGISQIESSSIPGLGILNVYFEQGTDIGEAIAQITASSSVVLRSLPPGMTPPLVIKSNAASVPVAQYTIFSDILPEEKLSDYALNFVRIKLFTIPGLSVPAPYGGKSRQINIDVSPDKLQSKGLSPEDVVVALNNSNVILPAGTARIGSFEYNILLNASPDSVPDFNHIPIKVVNGAPITIGDIGTASDSFADQTNVVRVNGKRATYLNILKKADASTLDVVNAAKKIIPEILATAPKGFNIRLDFDQSIFVKSAIQGVLREAMVSGILVALMILLFLGSWRSVIIVCTSIPAAICAAIIGLNLFGHSINIMTLGGLSLAIGMLVDDATVEVENIHRNRGLGKPLTIAILDGAQQIALPAIMATLAICIVFFPVVLLTGPARYLFIPMALSVVFSMLASYVLSRTLVPLLSRMLLVHEPVHHTEGEHLDSGASAHGFFAKFEAIFATIQSRYTKVLELCLANRPFILWLALALMLITMVIPFFAGTDFFPSTDTGLMKLHFRAAPGTRIEETENQVAEAEKLIRGIIPEDEILTVNSNIGVPVSYNLGFVPTNNVGGMDAELMIALKEDHHPTVGYMRKIREQMKVSFPGAYAYFQPADIVNQVLNFGLSAPIDVQIEYIDVNASYAIAQVLMNKMKGIPGLQDIAMKQVFNYPTLRFNVDRVRAAQVGVNVKDVANSMLVSLSSSSLVAPSYFLNPQNNINYGVAVKTPLEHLSRVEDLLSTPVTKGSNILVSSLTSGQGAYSLLPSSATQRLGNISTMESLDTMDSANHMAVQRVVNVTASAEGRDLGGVVADIQKQIDSLGKLKPGMKISVKGQGQVMHEAFGELGLGLVISILLVYLLMVILFQSWLDPFIVMVAVPGALCGILWMLFLTGTTINVESFMGAIMAVGIASSNSILLVSFANEVRLEKGMGPLEAALEAGKTRLRPVMMTALAMIIGMMPAALALGEGGEQNAPLGRAVIGGLLVATVVTLIVVPIVYSLLRKELPTKHLLDEKLKAEEEGRETWHQTHDTKA